MANKSVCRPILSEDFLIQEGLWDIEDQPWDDVDEYYDYSYEYDLDFPIHDLEKAKFYMAQPFYRRAKDFEHDDCIITNDTILYGHKIERPGSRYEYYIQDDNGVSLSFSYLNNTNEWKIIFVYNHRLKFDRNCNSVIWSWKGTIKEEVVPVLTSEIANKYIKHYYEKKKLHQRMLKRWKIKNIGRMKWEV